MPSHSNSPEERRQTVRGFVAGMAFLAFNLLGLGLLALFFRSGHFFQTVFGIYVTNVLIFPAIFVLVVIYNRRASQSKKPNAANKVLLVSAALLVGIFCYATLYEPQQLRLEQVAIESKKVTRPIRILHISDIQSGAVGAYERRVFSRIKSLNPDMIIHTGDLLQSYKYRDPAREQEKLAKLFRTLDPPYGIYNVAGNVDWLIDPQKFDRIAGTRTLTDISHKIILDGTRINLLGLSWPSSSRGNRSLIKKWRVQSGANEVTILFGHAPDYVLNILDMDLDLCLAGHTHGGQIRLPVLGPLITLSRIPKEWAMGYRKIRNIRLNVSAGIGAEHGGLLPSIRVNCPPAMTMFEFVPPRTSG